MYFELVTVQSQHVISWYKPFYLSFLPEIFLVQLLLIPLSFSMCIACVLKSSSLPVHLLSLIKNKTSCLKAKIYTLNVSFCA